LYNKPLPVQPIAECSYCPIIGVLPISAIKAGQEVVDVNRCEIIVGDEPSQQGFIEFKCSRRCALSSGFEELG